MNDSSEDKKKRVRPRITKDNAYEISRELEKWLKRRIEKREFYDWDGSVTSSLSSISALIPHAMYSEAGRVERKKNALDSIANLENLSEERLAPRLKRHLERAKETILEIDSSEPVEVPPEAIDKLRSWVAEHLSGRDWQAVLGAIRQRKHKAQKGYSEGTAQIPVRRSIFRTLKALKGDLSWDHFLNELLLQYKDKEQN